MPDGDIFDHMKFTLRPDPTRTMVRPFVPSDPESVQKGQSRPRRIADRIAAIPDKKIEAFRVLFAQPLAERMADPERHLAQHYERLRTQYDLPTFEPKRAAVAGAFFSQEYAFESAALFNPSIVLHPDQGRLETGEVRLVMSLRGIGEGHVSSATFRVLRWKPGGEPVVEPTSDRAVMPEIDCETGDIVTFSWPGDMSPSDAVLFPVLPSQRQGIEDVRMVNFTDDDGASRLFATYTAFSGSDARSEMLETRNHTSFTLRPLTGLCVQNKGMALFPRRIDGRFAMLGRIDNENLFLMRSDDPYRWDTANLLIEPKYDWEAIQIGNCGSPIEIDEGWLVLTHGVGMVRSYAIGAVLLDRNDPSRVLGRTAEPILRPRADERGGYVPNVVYSCGGIVHDRTLMLPYAVADQFTAFGTAPIERVLAALS